MISFILASDNTIKAQNGTSVNNQNESIIAHTDKKSYVVGEDVIISGKVSPVIKGERLRIDVFDPKGAVFKDNIGIAYLNQTDGTFSTYGNGPFNTIFSSLQLDNNSVKSYGTYKAMITYNGENIVITFNVTPTA